MSTSTTPPAWYHMQKSPQISFTASLPKKGHVSQEVSDLNIFTKSLEMSPLTL